MSCKRPLALILWISYWASEHTRVCINVSQYSRMARTHRGYPRYLRASSISFVIHEHRTQ